MIVLYFRRIYKLKNYKQNSVIFVTISLLSSGINYLSQMIIGKFLTVETFGIINAIFSFLLVIAVPGTTLSIILAKKISSENFSRKNINIYLLKLLKINIYLIFISIIVSIVCSAHIGEFIKTDNKSIILTILLYTSIGYFAVAIVGVFTGLNEYIIAGIMGLCVPIFKFIGVIISLFLEMQSMSAVLIIIISMLIGTIFASLIGLYIIYKQGYFSFNTCKDVFKYNISYNSEYLETLISNFCIVILSNIDILLLNYFYTSEEVGLYSSVMLFGKIILYVATSLVTVMLPYVVSFNSKEKEQKKVLLDTCKYITIFSILCLIPINLFKNFFISMVFSEKYLGASKYMFLTSVIAIELSFLNIFMNFMIAKNKQKEFIKTAGVGLLALIMFNIFFINNPIQMLNCIIFVFLICIILCVKYCFGKD